jgi:DNA-binding NarL/FixJ family response regulator
MLLQNGLPPPPHYNIAIGFFDETATLLVITYLLLAMGIHYISRLIVIDTKSTQRDLEYNEFKGNSIEWMIDAYGISPREYDVLKLLAQGYSRPYIGEQLFLSTSTVKTHINNIYKKLGIGKHDSLLDIVNKNGAGDT